MRAQFFISTIILVAVSVSLIVIYLQLPEEVSVNKLSDTNQLFNNLLIINQLLRGFNDYFSINWLLPYEQRLEININNSFSLIDSSVWSIIDLPDNAYTSSLRMVDSDNKDIPFSVAWLDEEARRGLIVMQSSADSFEKPYYYLYFNKAPGKTLLDNQEQMYHYNSDGTIIQVRTNSYYAEINNGFITMINNTGYNNSLMFFNNFVNCSDGYYTQNNNEIEVIPHDYFLEIKVKGYHFSNDTYIIRELFAPDRIIIIDSTRFAYNSECSFGYALSVNKTLMNSYLDDDNNVSPVTSHDWSLMGSNSWFELHGSSGLGLVINKSVRIESKANDTDNIARLILINNSISKGDYFNIISIVPTFNLRLNETGQQSVNELIINNKTLNNELSSVESFINNYFLENNLIVGLNYSAVINNKVFAKSRGVHEIEWLVNNVSNLRLISDSLINHQVSTDNFLDNSSFNGLNNTNTLLLFKPAGSYLNISFTTSDSLTVSITKPDDSHSSSVITGDETISLNDDLTGFYNLTVSGGSYSISSTAPKTIAVTPLSVSNNSPLYLFINENTSNLNLTINSYGSQVFELFSPVNESIINISFSEAGTSNISPAITKCVNGCVYKLTVNNNSPFSINSSVVKYVSRNKLFMINPDKPLIKLITDASIRDNSWLSIDYNGPVNYPQGFNFTDDFVINNSFYSFDLTNLKFIYKGVNWFSGGWLSCSDNNCVNSFSSLRYVEQGSDRVVVLANTSVGVNYYFYFYAHKPVFKVRVISDNPYAFGPEWSVNGSDNHYIINGLSKNLDSDVFIDKFNLTGRTSYVGKSDDYCYGNVLFNTNVLCYNNPILINNSLIRFNGCVNGDYLFIINDKPSNYEVNNYFNQFSLLFNFNVSNPLISINGSYS